MKVAAEAPCTVTASSRVRPRGRGGARGRNARGGAGARHAPSRYFLELRDQPDDQPDPDEAADHIPKVPPQTFISPTAEVPASPPPAPGE